MSEGTEYYQQIGQLQKALRERELHRLDLERENLSKIQRREKRHEQLRSRIKALHRELVQEEIESTQRVTLLLSQVDAARREHELIEARTERLRQKKHQYELLLSSSSLDPQASPGYGLHCRKNGGADSVKFRVQPDASHTLRPSQQQFGPQQYHQYSCAPTSMPSTQQSSTQVTFQNTGNLAQAFSDQVIDSASRIPQHFVSNGSGSVSTTQSNYGVPNSGQSFATTVQRQGKPPESLEHRKLQRGVHSDTNSLSGGLNKKMFGAGNTIDSAASLDSYVANSELSFRNTDHSLNVTERISDIRQRVSGNLSPTSSDIEGVSGDHQAAAPHFSDRHAMTERTHDRITNSPSVAVPRDSLKLLPQRQHPQAPILGGCYQSPQQSIQLGNYSQPSIISEPPPEKSASPKHMLQMSLPSEHVQASSLPEHSPETPTSPQHQQQSSFPPNGGDASQPRRVSEASLGEQFHNPRETTLLVAGPDRRERELYPQENYSHLSKHSASEEPSALTARGEVDAPKDDDSLNRSPYSSSQRPANGYSTKSLHVGHEASTSPRYVEEEYDRRNAVDSSPTSDRTVSCQSVTSVDERERQQEPLRGPSEYAKEPQSLDAMSRSDPSLSEGKDVESEAAIREESTIERLPEGPAHPISSLSSAEKSDSGPSVSREASPRDCSPLYSKENSRPKGLDDARTLNRKSDEPAALGHFDASKSVASGAYKKEADEDDDSDFFDRDVTPLTASRAYKNLLGDMSIGGGPAVGTESDSDDIEAQMSSLAVKETSGKKAAFRPFASSIPSLRPAVPGTDTDSVDSVEAAIQAAMNKPKQEASEKIPEAGPQKSTPQAAMAKSSTSFQEKEMVLKATGGKAGGGKPKASAALALKLDSDSESYGVSGGDNESEDDFDFYD